MGAAMCVFVRAAATAAWVAALALSFTPADQRLWACLLVGAGVLSLSAITCAIAERRVEQRIDAAYVEMAKAMISRPYEVPAPRLVKPS